jgi:hypothetical protein
MQKRKRESEKNVEGREKEKRMQRRKIESEKNAEKKNRKTKLRREGR